MFEVFVHLVILIEAGFGEAKGNRCCLNGLPETVLVLLEFLSHIARQIRVIRGIDNGEIRMSRGSLELSGTSVVVTRKHSSVPVDWRVVEYGEQVAAQVKGGSQASGVDTIAQKLPAGVVSNEIGVPALNFMSLEVALS